MICERCGTENRAGRRFCKSCGAGLAASCPVCGAPAESGDRFCGVCGSPLPESTGSEPGSAPSARAGDRPVPGADPGPTERRIVSVLFADLVGFTALSDDRDPEAVREFLDGYFALARERIGRYGGTIEKFIGDAVMAVWGTPVAHEDDAERAVRAAVDLLDAVGGLRTPDGSPIAVRRAVVTGEAAVTLGADGQGMVAGDLVNTASRLQSVAPPGSVLVGEATVRASESAIAYEPVGDQLLRGKQLPGRPRGGPSEWSPDAAGSGRSTRLEAPFVGRDDELRLLKELLHATARDRRARLVSVLGHPGHRQEPARLGAREVRRRARRDHLLAPGPVARVRRRRSRSGRSPRWSAGGPGSPSRTRPRWPGRSSRRWPPSTCRTRRSGPGSSRSWRPCSGSPATTHRPAEPRS